MSWKKKLAIGGGIAVVLFGVVALSGTRTQTLGLGPAPAISTGGAASFGDGPKVGAIANDLISTPSIVARVAEAFRRSPPPPPSSFDSQARSVAGAPPPAYSPPPQAYRAETERPGSAALPVLPQAAPKLIQGAPPLPPTYPDSRDNFAQVEANPVSRVSEKPVSTFSVDVDTASYSLVRRMISHGVVPPRDAIRIEELVNYFDYDYPLPELTGAPFTVAAAIAPSPFANGKKLMRIGIKGRVLPDDVRSPLNLVLLVDVSGSMSSPDKLPLLKHGLLMLAETLQPGDRVSIVTYAGSAGTVLMPTSGENKREIIAAIERLTSGGGTAGSDGIRQAYALAEANFDPKSANRVMLATDGDFNVGITDPRELEDFVASKRQSGIFLTVLGFGQGNLNDSLMQRLAQKGNGVAAYIDGVSEARRVLVEKAGSSLHTIAKDMKVQVEFNPAAVSEYRLIGYETRMLAREDFNNDKVDAGDIGEGHTVTALYEITPVGGPITVDDLRYGSRQPAEDSGQSAKDGEYAFVKVRWKEPKSETSELLSVPVSPAVEVGSLDKADESFRFAASVAAFGEVLRGGKHAGSMTLPSVEALAQGARGRDEDGRRAEFVRLVRDASVAKSRMGQHQLAPARSTF